jgi:hypothetical protein
VEISNTPFEDVMGWSVCQVFTLASYAYQLEKIKEQQRKIVERKYGR